MSPPEKCASTCLPGRGHDRGEGGDGEAEHCQPCKQRLVHETPFSRGLSRTLGERCDRAHRGNPYGLTMRYAESVRSRKPPENSYVATTTASASRSARSPRSRSWTSASGVQRSACIPRNPSGESETVSGGAQDAHTAPPARARNPTSSSWLSHSTQLSRCGT